MTAKAARTKKASAPSKAPQNNALTVKMAKDDSVPLATAKAIIAPPFRHAITVTQLNKAQLGGLENAPGGGRLRGRNRRAL